MKKTQDDLVLDNPIVIDWQKHLDELKRILSDDSWLYGLIILILQSTGKTISRDRVTELINGFIDNGLLNPNENGFHLNSIYAIVYYLLSEEDRDENSDYVQDVYEIAKDAVEKAVFDVDDPLYFIKACILTCLCYMDGTREYSIDEAKEGIDHFLNALPISFSSLLFWAELILGFMHPLLKGFDYLMTTYPLGLSNYLKEMDSRGHSKIKYIRASFEETFSFIRTMSPFGIRRLISEIECPSYCEDSLLEAISKGDYVTFKTICNNEKLTLTSELTAIVGYINAFIKKPLAAFESYKCKALSVVSGNENNHEVVFSLPTLENEPIFKELSATMRSVFGEDNTILKTVSTLASNKELILKYLPCLQQPYEFDLSALLAVYLSFIYSLFDFIQWDEAEVINPFLGNPRYRGVVQLAQVIYYRINKKLPHNTDVYISVEEQDLAIDNQPPIDIDKEIVTSFALPNDFFMHPIIRKNRDEYFDIKLEVEEAGAEKFSDFINMIATEGLIDFSERSKQLFAYVLTGRDRPKDYQEGEKCEWLDPLQGYELFYILMTLTGSGGSEKKYTKMKRLFTGPLWNGSGKEKDQANSAPIKFRRKMNAIYPDICPVKEDKRP